MGITGATSHWPAHRNWDLNTFLEKHSNATYQLVPEGVKLRDGQIHEAKLGRLLPLENLYHMAHICHEDACYHPVARPYSPFLQVDIGTDYDIPEFLQPMRTFQMGIGVGK